MANIDNIEELNIGAASTFRKNINDNFNLIKQEWKGLYVGPLSEQAQAEAALKPGGIWIVTEENTSTMEHGPMSHQNHYD